jgi:hypothetical protein
VDSGSTTTEGGGKPVRCGYCPLLVVFLPTYLGTDICFDSQPMLRADDTEATGWVSDDAYLHGALRHVWAPRNLVEPAVVRRKQFVRRPHHCPGQAA